MMRVQFLPGLPVRGGSSMVERQPVTLVTGDRYPVAPPRPFVKVRDAEEELNRWLADQET